MRVSSHLVQCHVVHRPGLGLRLRVGLGTIPTQHIPRLEEAPHSPGPETPSKTAPTANVGFEFKRLLVRVRTNAIACGNESYLIHPPPEVLDWCVVHRAGLLHPSRSHILVGVLVGMEDRRDLGFGYGVGAQHPAPGQGRHSM